MNAAILVILAGLVALAHSDSVPEELENAAFYGVGGQEATDNEVMDEVCTHWNV